MSTGRHSTQTALDGIHISHAYEYANAAARTGASGFVVGDVGKLSKQTDTLTWWVLVDTTPTWKEITPSAASVAHSATTGQTADDHHNELHTIASHSDTTATGSELDTLTDGSNADALHSHAVAGAVTHASTTGQTADDHHNQVHDFAGADHNAATLAQVNAKISDATLDDSSATRTPSAHTIVSHDTLATGAQLNTLTDGSNADALHVHVTAADTFTTLSTDTTLNLTTHKLIKVDTSGGDITLTLPLSANGLYAYDIWKTSSDRNKVIITRTGTDTIIGYTEFEWNSKDSQYTFVPDLVLTWIVK